MNNSSKDNNNNIINIYGDVSGSNISAGNSASSTISSKIEKEVFFDAGARLRQVREEIRLTRSEFIEYLEFPSEKKYQGIEEQKEEVSLSLLEKANKLTGVSLEWLKHGKSSRYQVEYIYLNPIEEDLKYCAELKPQEYVFTLETKNLHVGLIAQLSKYHYKVIETGITLDFWNWVDEHWAISAFYKFLKKLSDPWHDIRGVTLNTSDDKSLYNGEKHFLNTSWKVNVNIVYDILDIEEKEIKPYSYQKMYGGNWMNKVHEELRYYLSLSSNKQNK